MSRKKTILNYLFLYSLLLLLVGCGVGKTLVLEPPEESYRVKSIEIVEQKPTIKVPENIRSKFKKDLAKNIYLKFNEGLELKLEYKFIQFNSGSRFTRWFWGGIGNAGEGSLTIQAVFYDKNGKKLSTIQVEGKIQSGFFGGSFDEALEKAAKELADYTIKNFYTLE